MLRSQKIRCCSRFCGVSPEGESMVERICEKLFSQEWQSGVLMVEDEATQTSQVLAYNQFNIILLTPATFCCNPQYNVLSSLEWHDI